MPFQYVNDSNDPSQSAYSQKPFAMANSPRIPSQAFTQGNMQTKATPALPPPGQPKQQMPTAQPEQPFSIYGGQRDFSPLKRFVTAPWTDQEITGYGPDKPKQAALPPPGGTSTQPPGQPSPVQKQPAQPPVQQKMGPGDLSRMSDGSIPQPHAPAATPALPPQGASAMNGSQDQYHPGVDPAPKGGGFIKMGERTLSMTGDGAINRTGALPSPGQGDLQGIMDRQAAGGMGSTFRPEGVMPGTPALPPPPGALAMPDRNQIAAKYDQQGHGGYLWTEKDKINGAVDNMYKEQVAAHQTQTAADSQSYGHQVSALGTMGAAQIGADASRFGHDATANAARYGADQQLAGEKFKAQSALPHQNAQINNLNAQTAAQGTKAENQKERLQQGRDVQYAKMLEAADKLPDEALRNEAREQADAWLNGQERYQTSPKVPLKKHFLGNEPEQPATYGYRKRSALTPYGSGSA